MEEDSRDETPLAEPDDSPSPVQVDSPPNEEPDSHSKTYGRMIQTLLMPDENGMVRKDMLVEFFQRTVGTMFDDDKATEVLEDLKCDNGTNMIRLECFLKSFAEKYCSEETLSGIVELLGSRPEALECAWDWKGMLSNIGLELSDAELKEAVVAAKNLAEMLLAQHEDRDPPDGENEEEGQGQILQAVQENLHLMGLGEVGEVIQKSDNDAEAE